MKPALLLRVAAVLTLLYCIGHSLGAPWTATKSAEAAVVVEAMKSVQFDAMGAPRSYWDFYFGFGVSISIYLLVQALVLWFLAGLANANAASVRGIVTVLLLGDIVNAVVIWKFFFIAPMAFAIAIAVCLGLALLSTRRA